MESTPTIEALREAAGLVGRGADADALRAIQKAQDALDAAKVAHLAALAETRGFESEGASSIGSWARLHLRIAERESATLTRAAATLARLPQVAEAAAAGRMRTAHVNVFSYGLRHVGAGPVEAMMDVLLQVATTCEPGELMQVMRALREAVFPDELDDAWAKGMDKADLQINPVPQGYHVNGFFPAHVGAKFRTVIDSLSAPVDADDTRTGAQRRVDAIEQLCDTILDAGLPTDNGVRPHLGVRADAETVHAAAHRQRGTTSEPMAPADLATFGPIGPALLAMIGCTADITPILTHHMPDLSTNPDPPVAGLLYRPDPQRWRSVTMGRVERGRRLGVSPAATKSLGGERSEPRAPPGPPRPTDHPNHRRWTIRLPQPRRSHPHRAVPTTTRHPHRGHPHPPHGHRDQTPESRTHQNRLNLRRETPPPDPSGGR